MFLETTVPQAANADDAFTGHRSLSTGHLPPASHQSRARAFSHGLFVFAYLGFFGVVINQFRFTLGLRYTNVTHSSIIVGLGPIYTPTLAVLFRVEHSKANAETQRTRKNAGQPYDASESAFRREKAVSHHQKTRRRLGAKALA